MDIFMVSTAPSYLLFLLIFTISFPYISQSQINDSFYFDLCAPSMCGNISVTFPFFPSETFGTRPISCGLPRFEINCRENSVATLALPGKSYRVKTLNPTAQLIIVSDTELVDSLSRGSCDFLKENLSLPELSFAPLQYPTWASNLSIFSCPRGHGVPPDFLARVWNYSTCQENNNNNLYIASSRESSSFGFMGAFEGCRYISFPVLTASLSSAGVSLLDLEGLNDKNLLKVLGDGFPLEWPQPAIADCTRCQNASGRCGFENGDPGGIIKCFCRGGCIRATKSSHKWRVIIGATTAGAFVLLAMAALLIFKFRKKALSIFNIAHAKTQRSQDENGQKVEIFLRSYQSTLPTKYSYVDIKKMTNGFKDKVGEGGYGYVFKGKLPDGRLIAAKMLEKSMDNGQDFINEVATIGRIHHINVVRLLGFCWEGSKRALVYEFMPNGSLGNFVSKDDKSHSLGWPRLLEIAIGIAHGIEYLHHGCDTRILHLDIKPHNILLDKNFQPKISDFGLAKSYSRKHSVVPMTGARGTIGYIAPEVFLRNLGGVSNKADVYSYGMLILEMVGARKNVELELENSSKDYFPNWICSQLEEGGEMELNDSIMNEDVFIARKMIMVGLWCIQMLPADRPSMSRALEMLIGSVESIQMPPKPYLFSPPRQHEISSIDNMDDLPLTSQSG